MSEENEKPIFKRPLSPEEKIAAKIQAGLEANEKARREPLLKKDDPELKKLMEENNG